MDTPCHTGPCRKSYVLLQPLENLTRRSGVIQAVVPKEHLTRFHPAPILLSKNEKRTRLVDSRSYCLSVLKDAFPLRGLVRLDAAKLKRSCRTPGESVSTPDGATCTVPWKQGDGKLRASQSRAVSLRYTQLVFGRASASCASLVNKERVTVGQASLLRSERQVCSGQSSRQNVVSSEPSPRAATAPFTSSI